MPKVICDETTCENWKQNSGEYGFCTCNEIELMDESCQTFVEHTDISSEYREIYFRRLASRVDKHVCRQEAKGKRYELMGLVFFTSDDDRWGTDDIWFTEQVTGVKILGADINDENIEIIKDMIEAISPVSSLPVATHEDLYG